MPTHLQMLERAAAQNYLHGLVLGDSAYGHVGYFSDRVTELGFQYALGVRGATLVCRIAALGRRNVQLLTSPADSMCGVLLGATER